jgi:hypothetical protein
MNRMNATLLTSMSIDRVGNPRRDEY